MNSSLKISDVTTGLFYKKRKRKCYSDTIYTFDIETCSLFQYDDKFDVFNYDLPKEYYCKINKLAIPYIWQFGIEDTVYYGREFQDFEKILLQLSDPDLVKTIWVHNLSYEMAFLINILDKYTISNMVARDVRKPISFHVDELNITFRCSYMLTNLSLEKAAEEYTSIEKLHTLNYDNMIRTPLTPLTDDELMYCEYDIKCLYEIIKHYLNKYDHIARIPLTSTGEVRQALRDRVDFNYIYKQWQLIPEPKKYLQLMACFQGGYTHANVLRVNKVIKNVTSRDIASSYPSVMVTEKYPYSEFLKIDVRRYKDMDRANKCYYFHVTLNEVNSRFYNDYLPYSKCEYVDTKDMIYDNGRIKYAHQVKMWCTDVDLEIIQANYDIGSIIYHDIYYAKAAYLDIRVIKFILEMYGNKTKLKGISDKEDIYKQSKAFINSLYGMSVTNPLKNSADFKNGEWFRKPLTMDFVKDILNDAGKSFSTLFYYAVGVWVTAYARRNLYMQIISSHAFDKDVCYCDTDSIKYINSHDDIFEEYNRKQLLKYEDVIKVYPELTLDDFMPADPKGVKHPIGIYEDDGTYDLFKTLGAKKYCYVDTSGLHITVSGVSKKGAAALKDINDFKKGFTWDYKACDKLAHYYTDDQPEIDISDASGNVYHNTLKHGVVLQPTTYTLGLTEDFITLINMMQEGEYRNEHI